MRPTGTKLDLFVGELQRLESHEESTAGPDFSILIRTVGNRNDLLREALLSVMAQTHQSFEVLLLFHTPDDPSPPLEGLQSLIRQFPARFAAKVRLIVVTRPGRSAPLNDGIEQARGRFVCILDDDDLLYDHHFESVSCAVKANPDQRVFQTYSSRRLISVHDKASNATFPYSVDRIETAYTDPFDEAKQLRENFVPSCNFVFSRDYANALGLRFDESLEVLEDWKFLMDLNRLAQVVTVPEITTAIGARSNQTNTVEHPALKELWKRNRQLIQRQLAAAPRLMGAKEMASIVTVLELSEELNMELCQMKRPIRQIERWFFFFLYHVASPFVRVFRRAIVRGNRR